jgi:hypothetical protein
MVVVTTMEKGSSGRTWYWLQLSMGHCTLSLAVLVWVLSDVWLSVRVDAVQVERELDAFTG